MNGDPTIKNTTQNNSIDPQDPILVDPIISKVKISNYLNNFYKTNNIKMNVAPVIETAFAEGKGNFNYFKKRIQNESLYAGIDIPSDEELDSVFNSFRDLDAEEKKRLKLKTNYILDEAKKKEFEALTNVDLPDEAVGTEGVEVVEKVEAPEKTFKPEDYRGISGGVDSKFDRIIFERTNEYINKQKNLNPEKYKEAQVGEENLKIFNDNDLYQHVFKYEDYVKNKDNPTYNFSSRKDGSFGRMIDGLGVEFIFNDAVNAVEIFNKKFGQFGYRAEPKIEKASPFAPERHSIVLFNSMGEEMFTQPLFHQSVAGISKEKLVELVGKQIGEDPTKILGFSPTLGNYIRPEVYTQQFQEFKVKFSAATLNDTPIVNLAENFLNAEAPIYVLRDHFYNMTELSPVENRMIVDIAAELPGFDFEVEDLYSAERSLNDERLYDPMKIMKFLNAMRDEIKSTKKGEGVEIVLPKNMQLDKEGGLFDTLQYQYDFGINTGFDGFHRILGLSDNLDDIILDHSGNRHTKRDLLNKALDHYALKLRDRVDLASRNVGFAMRINDNYKKFPLHGPFARVAFEDMGSLGVNVNDHFPTDGITIDGRPSTYEELYNIITDPSLNNDVRMDRIDVKIGNPNDYGILAPIIERAQALYDRNETGFDGIMGHKNWFTNSLDRTYEWFENLIQGAGIEMVDIGGSMNEIMKDALIATGMDRNLANFIVNKPLVLGGPALPGGPGLSLVTNPFTKQNAEDLREEYLPEWSTKVTDASDLLEFMTLANQPFSESLPYIAAFMVNPKLGVALVGVNSYGENLYGFNQRRENMERMEDSGFALTETELNMMDTTDWAIRAYSLGNASIETALTAAFTMRYFRQFEWMKRSKIPKDLQTAENARKLAEQYAVRFDKGYSASLNRLYQYELKAVGYELAEENLIATFQYMFESGFGLREFSYDEFAEIVKETSAVTAFSSMGMAGGLRISSNINLSNAADNVISNNIGTGEYYKLADTFLNVKQSLNTYIQDQKAQGKTDKQIQKSQFYKWADTYLKDTKIDLQGIEKNRADLIKKMSREDKIRFLDGLASMAGYERTIANTTQTSVVRAEALESLNLVRNSLYEIVSGLETKGAYEFLSPDMKAKYYNDAYMEVYNDEKIRGQNLSEKELARIIKDKAADYYLRDVKNKKDKNEELPKIEPLIAPSYGNIDPASLFTADLDPEFSKTFNLSDQIDLSLDRLISEISILESTKGLEKQDGEENIDTTKELEAKVNKRNKIQEIVDKISKYNKFGNNEFMQNLSNQDRKFVIKFFQEINGSATRPIEGQTLDKDDRAFQFQRMNSIVDAYGIATEIATQLDAPIDIFTGNKNLAWLLQNYAGQYSVPFLFPGNDPASRNIATLDVLKNLLIRDKNIAAPFLNLYERIMGKSAAVTQRNSGLYNELVDLYFKGKGGPSIRRSLSKLGFKENVKRKVDIYDDIEMSILSGLGRVNLDKTDGITEFERYKKNLLLELQRRKDEADGATKNKEIYQSRYEQLKTVMDKLKIETATSYDDVVGLASSYNVDVVNKIRELFKERQGDAKSRVDGFGQKWTNFENYMPLFVKPIKLDKDALDQMQYEDPTADLTGGKINTAGSLQYATVPDSYIDAGYRLNFGDYFKNAFHALKGSDMDASVRQDVMTMYSLFNNPLFAKQFSSKKDFATFKALYGEQFLKAFNYEVNKGRNPYTDYGDANIFGLDVERTLNEKVNQVVSTGLSIASAVSLASLPQPTQQFYSAVGNNMIRVSSPEAKRLLSQKMFLFPAYLAEASNGTKAKTIAGRLIQDLFGQGDKSNIYALSQTALRNSIKAELPLEQDTSRDISYYATALNIDAGVFGKYGIGGSYTFDQLMKKIQGNTELSLELFLAKADKAAANASFEAHYLDYKIKNGAKYPEGSKERQAWWAKENENPDKEAINYADALVKELMRPSGDLSEAGIYRSDQNSVMKNALRTFMPFAKFGLNAKTNYWVQYAIANDPNVPADQQREARAAMSGIMTEITTFQGLKVTLQSAMYGTLASVLLGFDEDEIERYGGPINEMLTQDGIFGGMPIDDPEFMKYLDKEFSQLDPLKDLSSMEAVNAYYKAYLDYRAPGVHDALQDLQKFGNTFTNKTNLTPKNNNIMQGIVQDVIRTLNPVVLPEFANTAMFATINHVAKTYNLVDENIFLEYASEDLFSDELTTPQKMFEFFSEHMGLYGIAGEQLSKVESAFQLLEDNSITKTVPPGIQQTQYVGTGHELINQKIDKTIATLVVTRMLLATGQVPGVPAAEITRYLDRMERGLEKYVNTTRSAASGTPQSEQDPMMKTTVWRYIEDLDANRKRRKVPKK